MRIVKKPEVRKQEILDGAIAIFLKKGYERTTIGDIATELGISQGLCYRYFASKEAIYDAVIDAYACTIVQENLNIRPGEQSIEEWVRQIPELLAWMAQAEAEDSPRYALLHSPQNRQMHVELCFRIGEKLLPSVTQVLEAANARGEIHLMDCAQTAVFGIYGEIGLLICGGMDCADAIRENWRMLLGLK